VRRCEICFGGTRLFYILSRSAITELSVGPKETPLHSQSSPEAGFCSGGALAIRGGKVISSVSQATGSCKQC
jgi:hypothetical protein